MQASGLDLAWETKRRRIITLKGLLSYRRKNPRRSSVGKNDFYFFDPVFVKNWKIRYTAICPKAFECTWNTRSCLFEFFHQPSPSTAKCRTSADHKTPRLIQALQQTIQILRFPKGPPKNFISDSHPEKSNLLKPAKAASPLIQFSLGSES